MPPRKKPLEKSALSVQVYEALKIPILDQEIAPDSTIGIDTVAEEFSVSQTPVREALARLEGDGLVIRDARGRYRAAPLFVLDDFLDLYEVRLQLEPFAAAKAAEQIRKDELAQLARTIEEMRAAGRRGRSVEFAAFISADAAFHSVIALATRNSILADALQHLHSNHRLGTVYRRRGVADADKAIRDHVEILEALKARDPKAARRSMTDHVERSRAQVVEWLSAHADEPSGDEKRAPAASRSRRQHEERGVK
jgi:DNA-binding GntR family transcriptional regulator